MTPTDPACERARHELGGAVLGGLDHAELQELEAHLARCPSCREEYAELQDLPPLLELARGPRTPVPARLRDRVVASAVRRQGRRRWLAGAAAAAMLAALVGVVIGRASVPEPTPAVAIALESPDAYEEAGGWAWLQPSEEGFVLELTVRGLEPVADPEVYEAWLYTTDERIVSIGQLTPSDGEVDARFELDGDLEAYQGFWITAEPDRRDPAHEGPTVLRASLPSLQDTP